VAPNKKVDAKDSKSKIVNVLGKCWASPSRSVMGGEVADAEAKDVDGGYDQTDRA
jgi:hypothetical protein